MTFRITHLTIRLHDGTPLVNDFSYVINPGDKIALIGEEGVGKTTLLKAILNPQLVDDYASVEGNTQHQHEVISYMPQVLQHYDLQKKPSDYLAPFDIALYYTLAKQLSIPADLLSTTRSISTLSGGEKVKLMLMKALLHTPDVLILDEPTNDLDLIGLQWLENILFTLDVPLLMISHDERLIDRLANRIIHLERIRHKQLPRITTYEGTLSAYRQERERRFAAQDQQAIAERRLKHKKEKILQQFHEKLDHQMRLAVRQPSWGRLLKKKMKIVTAQEKKLNEQELTSFHEETESFYVLVTPFEGLSADHRLIEWSHHLVELPNGQSHDLSWLVQGQDHLAIVGPNGIGKTTLIKHLVDDLRNRHYAVGYIPQDYAEVWDQDETPLDLLRRFLGFSKDVQTQIRTTLAIMHIPSDELNRPYSAISGGTRAKVLWAAVLLSHPDVLILDEPTRNISPLVQPALRDMMNHYPGCVITVTHDRQWLEESSEVIYQLTKEGLSLYES